MKNVAVIIGGGSGIGLATAKCMPKDKIIVIACRTHAKLEDAVGELKELGYEAYYKVCDIADREQVKELAEYCTTLGEIKNLILTAAVSAGMVGNDPSQLLKINSLGTVHVVEEFSKKMNPGSVILCTASVAAYIGGMIPTSTKKFLLAETNEELFIKKNLGLTKLVKDEYDSASIAYIISKKFVIWYVERCAFDLAKKGIRICSISHGFVDTSMGNLEYSYTGDINALDVIAVGRMGKREEAGYAFSTIADERNGYIIGTDILMDGAYNLGFNRKKDKAKYK